MVNWKRKYHFELVMEGSGKNNDTIKRSIIRSIVRFIRKEVGSEI